MLKSSWLSYSLKLLQCAILLNRFKQSPDYTFLLFCCSRFSWIPVGLERFSPALSSVSSTRCFAEQLFKIPGSFQQEVCTSTNGAFWSIWIHQRKASRCWKQRRSLFSVDAHRVGDGRGWPWRRRHDGWELWLIIKSLQNVEGDSFHEKKNGRRWVEFFTSWKFWTEKTSCSSDKNLRTLVLKRLINTMSAVDIVILFDLNLMVVRVYSVCFFFPSFVVYTQTTTKIKQIDTQRLVTDASVAL